VDGPASVTFISGKAEVFGLRLTNRCRMIVREGKRLPFTILETATFDIALGKDSAATEIDGTTIPLTWQSTLTTFRKTQTQPATVMIIGGVDSGKSSLCTYLANRLANEHCRVAVLDEDLGQSDIGPPCTVAFGIITNPVTDLFNVKPENVVFVGVTSPSEAPDKTVQAAAALATDVRAKADFIIVNTDGWTLGDDAVAFKKRLAEAVKPDLIFFLQHGGEPICLPVLFKEALADFEFELVDAPPVVRERNREKRRSLRELGFVKYLENARVRVFPLSHIVVEGERRNMLFQQGEAENLLVGLHDVKKRFLGIGIIRGVDFVRKSLRVFTAVEEKPGILVLGRLRLDKNLREIPKINE